MVQLQARYKNYFHRCRGWPVVEQVLWHKSCGKICIVVIPMSLKAFDLKVGVLLGYVPGQASSVLTYATVWL